MLVFFSESTNSNKLAPSQKMNMHKNEASVSSDSMDAKGEFYTQIYCDNLKSTTYEAKLNLYLCSNIQIYFSPRRIVRCNIVSSI